MNKSDLKRIIREEVRKVINTPSIVSETDSPEPPSWKEMGFKSEEEYNKFLNTKMKDLMDRIKSDPKLLNVFKRLNDK